METVINLLNEVARAHGVRIQQYGEDFLNLESYDDGLRSQLIPSFEAKQLSKFLRSIMPGTVYMVKDIYRCNYCMFKLPEASGSKQAGYWIIGPWLEEKPGEADIDAILRQCKLPYQLRQELVQYFEWIPHIRSSLSWKSTVYAFVRCLYGYDELPWISIPYIDLDLNNPAMEYSPKPEALFAMKKTEARCQLENAMVEAIGKGEGKRTFQYFIKYRDYLQEQRVMDEVRSWKHYAIALNTLARKAAEQGFVHPVHIDVVSTGFARRIENTVGAAALIRLCEEILHCYCKLVRDFSLKDFSPVIRNVINFVDINLREPLSLNMLASRFNVNPSYLSALFKKEKGITLTDYINTKRIQQAASLLHGSGIYVQDVAAQCGFLDINYFDRLFKRYYGQSPREFRACVKMK
jgi:AraC-like DNA-binding protein